jgi:hypothetical protein
MTEPRNPLEVVEEALERIEGMPCLCFIEDDFLGDGPPVHHQCSGCEARAALALVRKMRADAVVGWVSPVIDDSWFEDLLVCPFRAFAWEAEPDNPRYTRALLLPLPDSPEDDDG